MYHTCVKCNESKYDSEIVKTKCNQIYCLHDLHEYIVDNLKESITKIKCPIVDCDDSLKDSIIRQVLSEIEIIEYEEWCLNQFKLKHRCVLKHCSKLILYTNDDVKYQCSNCNLFNCVKCKMPHIRESCESFQKLSKEEQDELIEKQISKAQKVVNKKNNENIQEIIKIYQDMHVWPSENVFVCQMCGDNIGKGKGICIKSCLNLICRNCLSQYIERETSIPLKCPLCKVGEISDREIMSILDNNRDLLYGYRRKCINFAAPYIKKLHKCRYPDCDALFYVEDNVNIITCYKCASVNCTYCKAIHSKGRSCDDYKAWIEKSKSDQILKQQIANKQLLICPDCSTIIRRTRGCGWIQCTCCGTELCWYLQSYRWGEKGCKCGENGKTCYSSCNGCTADTGRMISTAHSPSNNGGTGYSQTNRPR